MGCFDVSPSTDLAKINNDNTLALLTHLADMLSCFVDEKIVKQ